MVLAQMCSCLLDEVACLMEAYPVAFCIADCLADSEIVSLSSVTVVSGTFEAVDGSLFKTWHCGIVRNIVDRVEKLLEATYAWQRKLETRRLLCGSEWYHHCHLREGPVSVSLCHR
jgi:hypothetical protein